MPKVQKSIVVDVPVQTAYNQWTQFESFPQFMDGVKEVHQLDDKRLHWKASVFGKDEEWNAEIMRQEPNRLISWRSTTGAPNDGMVRFEPMGNDQTRVDLELDYEPQGAIEKTGEVLGLVQHQVEKDLDNFKKFIESRGQSTGAWRGRIEGGNVKGS